MDIFRDWEYPAVLAALGIHPDSRYLCIGGFGDALGVWLSHHVGIDVVDRVAMQAVKDYPLSYGHYWHNQTQFYQGDWADIADNFPLYDYIFSVGSLEHNANDRDVLCYWHIGRHLNPGGRAVITVEWGEEYAHDYDRPCGDQIIGGHIYDNRAIVERIVAPSGLTMTRWEEEPPEWGAIKKSAPFIGRAVTNFCPALIVLEKPNG